MNFIKCIISIMLELIRRWGPYLLVLSGALIGAGFVPFINELILASILIWCLAFICFSSAIYAFIYDFIEARRRDRETKESGSRPHWPL